ncbi:MAG: hypothetical protein IT340_12410 [Chloroflexi bacterium]|nr:hypothetical protein [Chloroflexota bacterium]
MARPRVHLAATVLALALLRRRLSWPERAVALVAGVLVDADHLVDLALARWAGRRRWVVLPLHGWELVAALLLGGRGALAGPARVGALALLLHLLLDLATNRPARPALYSLLYRGRHGFRADRLRAGQGRGGWMRQRWWQWL